MYFSVCELTIKKNTLKRSIWKVCHQASEMLGAKNTDLGVCVVSNGRPSFTSKSDHSEPKSTGHRGNNKIVKLRKQIEKF